MSYPGYKYSPYIGQSTNDQGMQSHDQLNSTSQSHQPTPDPHYANQQSYGWSQQQQPAYGDGDAYNYSQRSQIPYEASSSVAASNYYHATPTQPQPSPPALDSLAYVSGLESAGLNNRSNHQAGSTSYDMNRQQAPERVTSPYEQNFASANDSFRPNRPPSAAPRSSQQRLGHKSFHQSPNLAASALQDTLGGYPSHSLSNSTYGSSSNTATTSKFQSNQSPSVTYSNLNTSSQNQGSGNRPRLSTPVGGRASQQSTEQSNQQSTQQSSNSRWNPPQQSHARVPSSQGYGRTSPYSTTSATPNAGNTTVSTGLPYSNLHQTSGYQGSNTHQHQINGHETGSGHSMTNANRSTEGQVQNTQHDHGSTNETRSYQNQMSPTQTSIPSFIDPSQVYNPYKQEYEKRKAAEEAEAERLATEQKREIEREQSSAPESETAQNTKERERRSRKSAANSKSARSNADSRRRSQGSVDAALQAAAVLTSGMASGNEKGQTEDEEAREMKMMLEKMQQLKSKDPTKFQQILGNLTEADEGAPQQSPLMGPPMASQPPSMKKDPTSRSGPRKEPERAFQYVPPEANEENLPDLGKFPVQRRMRYKTQKKDSRDDSAADDSMAIDQSAQPTSYISPYAQSAASQTSMTQTSLRPGMASSGGGFKFPTPANLRFQAPLGVGISHMSSSASSAPTNQLSYPRGSSSTPAARPSPTVWPHAKRQALAEAAIQTLLLNPANANKGLTPDFFVTLLELNPSYPELCEKLESRGVTLHRGNFAKSLLQSVPDLASSSSPSQPISSGSNAVVSPTAHVLKLPPQQGAQAVAQLNTQVAADSQTGAMSSPAFASSEPGQPLTWKPKLIPGEQLARGPSSIAPRRKSKMQSPSGSSSTPSGPKDVMARKRNFSDIVDLTQSLESDEDEHDYPPTKQPRLEDPNIDPQLFRPAPGPSTLPSGPPMRSTPTQVGTQDRGKQQEEISRRAHVKGNMYLVKPVNKANALRKSFYNPLTIARDILLASGRHPTEDPLNAHLARLTTRLPQINFEADFFTLRWDIIDPGGPEVMRDESTRIPSNQRSTVAGYGQELTTTQSQLVRLAHKQRAKRAEAQQSQQSSLRNVTNLQSDRDTKSPVVEIITPHASSPSAKQIPPARMRATSTPDAIPKKRGRPPGSKNKGPNVSKLQQIAREDQLHAPRTGRPPKPIPRKSSPLLKPPSYSVYNCRWSGCQAELHNLETLKKHFVKVHQYDEGMKDNRCLWTGCGTKVEAYDKPSNSYRIVTKRHEFSDRDSWMDHILTQHLDPLGWSLGEGPSVRTNDPSAVPPYLLDSTGHLVTPVIQTDSGRQRDTMHFVKPTIKTGKVTNKDGLVKYNKLHGKDTPQEKAKEVLRAIEAKKARIGTLIDKGGCTMVNRNNRHILEVVGEAKVITQDDEWLYEGRDEEPEIDIREPDPEMDTL